MNTWINQETTPWLFEPIKEGIIAPSFDPEQDRLTLLLHAGVRTIREGLQDDVKHWECGHCGQVNEGYGRCANCNGPRLSRLRQAEVVLEGILPHAAYLAELSRHFGLEITHHECNRRDVYALQDVIMRFLDCRVTGRWIDDPVILWSEQAKVMTLHVRVACQFYMMRANGGFSLVTSEKEH